MMASAAAPAMEYVFVNASGPNRRPSCPSEGKDRNKGQGDDQQANEQRGSHFHGGVGNHLPAGGVVNLLTRMLMIPLLKPFVRIFNHHNGGIHHRTDGNRYPSQRHDIGVQSLGSA